MFPSYKNQSVDLLANQLTGFYMMETMVVTRSILEVKFEEYPLMIRSFKFQSVIKMLSHIHIPNHILTFKATSK